ncbi:hypothetical protein ACJJTC_011114 [Scirpophaga incertulas]
MGKKVKEYKAGDFIFAKVKGYPAWPARVQRLNGKKYFVYFYGTGETANLPPNMIFDYAENKEKFLTKTVKRRDFNDGVRQIEHDFANNVPLEEVLGGAVMEPPPVNDSINDTANETINDSVLETTSADETMNDDTNTTQNDAAVEDSDETGNLVIDEGKKGRKSKAEGKTPAKLKTPRGKAKKDEAKEDDEERKKEDELISRSGRKIRPKRYIDEHTEENTTLPLPTPKRRRGASPEKATDKDKVAPKPPKPTIKNYNNVSQAELEDLNEPFKPVNTEKENILIAYLPAGKYVGIKLFQSRPNAFKDEATRLAWDKQSAANSITLKQQLERGQITADSIAAQLVMNLDLTDEEVTAIDNERDSERRQRVQFLRTEMKLIELDAKIKTCLCLEKADTELCLKLLDELMGLEVKPLMLLKHPTCLETVKRMRAYVGNASSWDLSENDAIIFSKQAHRIRKQADSLYNNTKKLFTIPAGLSFWEFFSELVNKFKKATSDYTADELLELVHEPLELSWPSAHTMRAAIDAANELEMQEEKANPPQEKETTATSKKVVKKTRTENDTEASNAEKAEDNTQEDAADINEKEGNNDKDVAAETDKEVNAATEASKKDKTEDPAEQEESQDPENKTVDESQDKESVNVASTESKKNEKHTNNIEDSTENDKKKETTSSEEEKSSDSSSKTKDDAKDKNSGKRVRNDSKDDKSDKEDEPKAKRSRESKKTDTPPARSPAKRKTKI